MARLWIRVRDSACASSILFGVAPADPVALSVVGVGLLATALAACAIPARKAMRVDPVAAVRSQELGFGGKMLRDGPDAGARDDLLAGPDGRAR